MEFKEAVSKVKVAKRVLNVSHYDADGLCSAKILKSTLEKEGISVHTKIVKELSIELIKEIKRIDETENFDLIIFSDLGSGYLSLLPRNKEIIILDHHIPEEIKIPDNILQINPCLEGKELCGAGICYLFGLHLNLSYELVDYAVIGAIGDHQLDVGKNREVLEFAQKIGRLKTERGLKIFGHVNRPIHESLQKADFFPMNGHSEIVQFLSELEINLHHNGRIRSYYDLTKIEKEKLCSEIVKERLRNNLENPADIFSDIYLLTEQPKELMDALEDSTILNAYGRLERYDEIFDVLDGKTEGLNEVMTEYRRKISGYLSWAMKNKANFFQTDKVIFVNAREKVDSNMIGTIISIMSNCSEDSKVFVGLANEGGRVKISARSKSESLDLNKLVSEVCKRLDGMGGGHGAAAGGKINLGQEEKFIKELTKLIEGANIE